MPVLPRPPQQATSTRSASARRQRFGQHAPYVSVVIGQSEVGPVDPDPCPSGRPGVRARAGGPRTGRKWSSESAAARQPPGGQAQYSGCCCIPTLGHGPDRSHEHPSGVADTAIPAVVPLLRRARVDEERESRPLHRVWIPRGGSDGRVGGRTLDEPLRDTRHAFFEVAGAETLTNPARSRAAVLEVMGGLARASVVPGAAIDQGAMTAPRQWISALGDDLAVQRSLLHRLVDAVRRMSTGSGSS